MVRVLREWVLARSAPASPLARACALHLLCRDAGFWKCRDGLLARLGVRLVLLLAAMRLWMHAHGHACIDKQTENTRTYLLIKVRL